MTAVTAPVIRYHGGKYRLAPWVMSFFPPHRIYCEPYGGAAGVLMQKPRAYSEIYNDLDGEMVNLFRCMQDKDLREQLTQACVLTPYAREEFDRAWKPARTRLERARRLIVRAQMGFGSAGATKGTTGFRIDTKRKYETAQHVWAKYPSNMAAIGLRLTGVLIENRPAIDVMRNHDTPDTLFYVDPPYIHQTRCRITGKGSARGYRHEMDDHDHAELLSTVQELAGMVVISGYPNALYDDALKGWERHATTARISGGRGTAMREEVVWINPACAAALHGSGLFAQPGVAA